MAIRRVSQNQWIELKKELFARYPMCQYCFKEDAWELAHALFHKRYLPGMKNAKARDVRENALPVCKPCSKFSETYAGRNHAWKVLCKREGATHMLDWYNNFPSKIKESFDEVC